MRLLTPHAASLETRTNPHPHTRTHSRTTVVPVHCMWIATRQLRRDVCVPAWCMRASPFVAHARAWYSLSAKQKGYIHAHVQRRSRLALPHSAASRSWSGWRYSPRTWRQMRVDTIPSKPAVELLPRRKNGSTTCFLTAQGRLADFSEAALCWRAMVDCVDNKTCRP